MSPMSPKKSQQTAVVVSVSTRTQVIVAVAAAIAFSLAAYGFGFLPLFEEDQQDASPGSQCRQVCSQKQALCDAITDENEQQECQRGVEQCEANCSSEEQTSDRQENQEANVDTGLSDEERGNVPQEPAVPEQDPVSLCMKQCEIAQAACADTAAEEGISVDVCNEPLDLCVVGCAPAPRPEPEQTPVVSPTSSEQGNRGSLLENAGTTGTTSTVQNVPLPMANQGTLSVSVSRNHQGNEAVFDTIVTPTRGAHRPIGLWRLTADDEEAVLIRRIRFHIQGAAAIDWLSARLGETDIGLAQVLDGQNEAEFLLARPKRLEPGESVDLWLSASILAINGTTVRSGDWIKAYIASNPHGETWSEAYENRLNVDAVGERSRAPIYTALTDEMGEVPEHVVRKNYPFFERRGLPSAVLSSGISMDLMKFHAATWAMRDQVAIKKIAFRYDKQGQFSVRDLRLRRGSILVPTSTVQIMDEQGNVYFNGHQIGMDQTSGFIIVIFLQEQGLDADGHDFSLVGTIGDTVTNGDRFSVSIYAPGVSARETGYLTTSRASLPDRALWVGPHLNFGDATSDRPDREGFLVWSDLSERTHNDRPGTEGGSRDWIGATGLGRIHMTETLER